MPQPLNLAKVLTDAKALIAEPDHWTKGSFARKGQDGIGIAPNDPNATCYCSFGAIMCVTSYNTPASIFDEMGKIATRLLAERDPAIEVDPGKNPIVFFNDHPTTTHEDVMLLFNQSIALLTEVPAL